MIPLLLIRIGTGPSASPQEQSSLALLRRQMAIDLPALMAQAEAGLFAASMVDVMVELKETATINGSSVDVIAVTPYQGAVMAGIEVEGRVTRVYVMADAFDDASGELGDPVVLRAITYAIGRIERMDAGMVRLELAR